MELLKKHPIFKSYLKEPYFFLFLSLLASLMLLPWAANNYSHFFITQLILTLLVIGGILAVGKQRKIYKRGLVIGITIIVLGWVSEILDNVYINALHFISLTLYMVFLTYNIIRNILKTRDVSVHIILGALCGYMMIGLTASFILAIIEYFHPGTIYFSHTDSPRIGDVVYFTFISLTTIGYGDAIPTHNLIKGFSYTLGIVGQFYMTVLVAFLMGKFLSKD